MTGNRFSLGQPAPDLDNIGDSALAQRANDLGVLGERDLRWRDDFSGR
jgi:hypothetical protein